MGLKVVHFKGFTKDLPFFAVISVVASVIAVASTSHISQATEAVTDIPVSSLETPEKTCCICTASSEPKWQVPIFKLGCSHWLNRQTGCDIKKTVTDWEQIEGAASSCKGGKVKLGYIGHGTERQSGYLVFNAISQLAGPKGLGASVDFDNTSCKVFSDLGQMKLAVDALHKAPGKYVRVTGAQSVSVGEFDHILPGLLQINAAVDSRKKIPELPLCSKVQDVSCLSFQEGNQVHCEIKDHIYATLTCQKSPGSPHYAGDDDVSGEKPSLRWTKTGAVSERDLFTPPKIALAPGTYQCTELNQKAPPKRFVFLETSNRVTQVEFEALNSNNKERGILTSSNNDWASFGFAESDVEVMIMHAPSDDEPNLMITLMIKNIDFLSYTDCKKVDSTQSADTPCATPDQTPLAPEQSSTLKKVEHALTSQRQ